MQTIVFRVSRPVIVFWGSPSLPPPSRAAFDRWKALMFRQVSTLRSKHGYGDTDVFRAGRSVLRPLPSSSPFRQCRFDLWKTAQGLWSTVVLVLRAKCDTYEVQVTSSGPVMAVPEKFTEKNLVRFLSEVLLSYS